MVRAHSNFRKEHSWLFTICTSTKRGGDHVGAHRLLMAGRSRGRLSDKEPVGLRGVTERRRGRPRMMTSKNAYIFVALSVSVATRCIQERHKCGPPRPQPKSECVRSNRTQMNGSNTCGGPCAGDGLLKATAMSGNESRQARCRSSSGPRCVRRRALIRNNRMDRGRCRPICRACERAVLTSGSRVSREAHQRWHGAKLRLWGPF